jgi:predicted nucleic acid-binding protein
MNRVAVSAVNQLIRSNDGIYLVPQNFYEFWVVATRPREANGLGATPPEAQGYLDGLRRLFPVLEETPAVFDEWNRIVLSHAVIGKTAHDARLVAAMSVHGLSHILTFNDGDFSRYAGIVAISPNSLVVSTS